MSTQYHRLLVISLHFYLALVVTGIHCGLETSRDGLLLYSDHTSAFSDGTWAAGNGHSGSTDTTETVSRGFLSPLSRALSTGCWLRAWVQVSALPLSSPVAAVT